MNSAQRRPRDEADPIPTAEELRGILPPCRVPDALDGSPLEIGLDAAAQGALEADVKFQAMKI
ncbi:hypothetical protein PRZ48_012315 [Zasmidium cellare]|uniref:Uncharacterized protein n=1 Tax=Zasmidium cellare TaxID=395010 RepID=A0ABR0E4N5_ZASCE|nr:hypothetical protein PRZ48_012315 [Zasmidium cellare]